MKLSCQQSEQALLANWAITVSAITLAVTLQLIMVHPRKVNENWQLDRVLAHFLSTQEPFTQGVDTLGAVYWCGLIHPSSPWWYYVQCFVYSTTVHAGIWRSSVWSSVKHSSSTSAVNIDHILASTGISWIRDGEDLWRREMALSTIVQTSTVHCMMKPRGFARMEMSRSL